MKCAACKAETDAALPYCRTCGAPTTGGAVPVRDKRLTIAGGIVGIAAAVPVGAVLVLPSYRYRGTSVSLVHGIPGAFALEPLGVAIVALLAGLVMAWGKAAWRRVAAGMLLAFGIQMFLFSIGTQYGVTPPATAGTAGIAGIVGALMLMSASVLGLVGSNSDRAASDLAGNQGINGWPNTL